MTHRPRTSLVAAALVLLTLTAQVAGTAPAAAIDAVQDAEAPVARSSNHSTPYETELVVEAPGVLANDSGVNLTASLMNQASNGVAVVAADGSFTYMPNAGWVGTDSFRYRIVDDFGRASYARAHIETVMPEAPKARSSSHSTPYETELVVEAPGVLANDSGVNLTASLMNQASNGVAVVAADGSFTYMPNAGWVGTDSFRYRIVDDFGRASYARAHIETMPLDEPEATIDTDLAP